MKIVVDENMPHACELFAEFGEVVPLPGRQIGAADLQDADVLLVRSVTRVDAGLLASCPRLAFVGTATIGTDHIDTALLAERGIPFFSAPGCNKYSVGDYVLSALLVLAERHELSLDQMSLAVIGAGNTGECVAGKAEALGMRVLRCDPPRARLEDARFFWEADCAATFDHWLDKLDKVIFIGPLGTMGDKTRRLEKLAASIAAHVAPELSADMARAGRLSKADLVSEMVYEFDDLQGKMGGIYARMKGEGETVAQALYEQYLPAGQDSPLPSSMGGAILSLADKLDNLAGCFGLGMMPTGAADPYALRRCTLGVCRIILELGLKVDIGSLLREAQNGYVGIN